jgi:hypothetical protein
MISRRAATLGLHRCTIKLNITNVFMSPCVYKKKIRFARTSLNDYTRLKNKIAAIAAHVLAIRFPSFH